MKDMDSFKGFKPIYCREMFRPLEEQARKLEKLRRSLVEAKYSNSDLDTPLPLSNLDKDIGLVYERLKKVQDEIHVITQKPLGLFEGHTEEDKLKLVEDRLSLVSGDGEDLAGADQLNLFVEKFFVAARFRQSEDFSNLKGDFIKDEITSLSQVRPEEILDYYVGFASTCTVFFEQYFNYISYCIDSACIKSGVRYNFKLKQFVSAQ